MARPFLLLLVTCSIAVSAGEPQERIVESVLPALTYGQSCWSTVDLHNLGDRLVLIDVEAHRASGALVALDGHPQVAVHLGPGERASYKLQIEEETGDAWVKVREVVPTRRMFPVVAIAGTTECTNSSQLRTTTREVAYSMRNPWFSGDVGDLAGDVIAVVNTSERPAKAALCYSAGNLYSVPNGRRTAQLAPICSQAIEGLIPPFGARQFPVQRDGSSHFDLKTQGEAIALEMLRPIEPGVKLYTVDSTIKFGGEFATQK